MQIVSIDLPFDREIGHVESRTLRDAPVAMSPAVVYNERNGWREKPGERPINTVVGDVAAIGRVIQI